MSSRPTTNQTVFGEVRQRIGPYQVLDVIGHGGMATVYKAMQPELERLVAVKVLLPAFANDVGFRARFEREARMIARLRHPNIVSIYGADEEAGMPYLVMEFLDGLNLHQTLRRRATTADPCSSADILALLRPLAAALDYAHGMGVIHRDLKPENIILTANGPVITDFGLAKLLQEEAATVSVVMGTPSYMAPEQIRAEPVDARSDVYALGIILYQLLTGRVPYVGPTPYAIAQAHVNDPVPSLGDLDPRWENAHALDDVARRAIAKRKADRWPSAGAMIAALERAFDVPIDPSTRPTVAMRPAGQDRTHLQPPPLGSPSRLKRPPSLDGVGRYVLIVPLMLLLVVGIWAASSWSLAVVSTRPSPRPPAVLATVVPSGVVATPTVTAPPNATVVPSVQAVVQARNGAYVRSGPGTNYEVVAGLQNGTTVVVEGTSNGWMEVRTPAGTRGYISSLLLDVTSGDAETLPVRSAPPTPQATTPPPTPPTGRVSGSVRLDDTAWTGGWRNGGQSIYGGRTATWVYGQGSNYSTMTASFAASRGAGGRAVLRIVGMDSEDTTKTTMRVTINGQTVFEGANPLPNDDQPLDSGRWDEQIIQFDAGLLRDGSNTVAITNLASGAVGRSPFVALDYATVELP